MDLLPDDAPTILGKYFRPTLYFDANIFHDQLNGSYITNIIHFPNKTPMGWYSKKHNTVEKSIYFSEFVSYCTCVDYIIDLRNTL